MSIIDVISTWVGYAVSSLLLTLATIFPILAPNIVVSTPIPAPVTYPAVGTPIPTTTTQTTTTKPKTKPATVAQDVSTLKPSVASTVSTEPSLSDADLNTQTRGALVNILCTVAGQQFKPISASGVIIDSRGVILTNAHMAQFLLLRDYVRKDNIDCVVRTGSPAQPRYKATLLYLPLQWVQDNADQLTAQQAKGTGENDYAFLLITGTTNPNGTLPSEFPHLAMSTKTPDIGQTMLLAAYPAGFLSGELINTSLYASSAFAYVTQLFSFDGTQVVDLFSIGGTVESQSGSSGGAAVRRDGTLAGIIVTATLDNSSTGARDLRAESLAHINRSLAAHGEIGVANLLSGDLAAKAAEFNKTTAPQETKLLEDVLNKTQ